MRLPPVRLCLLALGALCVAAAAAPLPRSAVPELLKPWVPWVLYGQESQACPAAYDGSDNRACVWPTRLELDATATGATFRFEVQVFGADVAVPLPGEPGRWPQDLKADGRPVVASARDDRPFAQLSAGQHTITGSVRWSAMPPDLLLPTDLATLRLTVAGAVVDRVPDADGRVWLQRADALVQDADSLTVRTARMVDDDIPLRLTTHYDIEVAGKPREIALPAALLAGFVPESLAGQLPARLQQDGSLRVQVRPGIWSVELRGRSMKPLAALQLPAGAADEIWSVALHNELRVVAVEGVTAIDPKQVAMPEPWKGLPSYQVKAGQSLKLVESRRGNPQPGADRLSLSRQIWLDFDGGGYTMQDRLRGELLRSWRLEMASPGTLGRATVDGNDQPVTRLAGAAADGVELRRGVLALTADSRIEGDDRGLPATGWLSDFTSASSVLNLPPGWRLLHASGVDRAEGSWVSRWTLWDFLFVLLTALAAGKLLGRTAGAITAVALVLTWHMAGAPQVAWIALVAALALARVLPDGRSRRAATLASWLCAGIALLWLVPYGISQIRLSIYPALELSSMQVSQPLDPFAGKNGVAGGAARRDAIADADKAVASPAAPPALAEPEAPSPIAAPKPEALKDRSSVNEPRESPLSKSKSDVGTLYAGRAGSSIAPAIDELDPGLKVQTGPGLPGWRWNTHRLGWQGPVTAGQRIHLFLLPPAATVALRLGGLALLIAMVWQFARALPAWRAPLAPSGTRLPRAPGAAALIAAGVLVSALAAGGDATAATPQAAPPTDPVAPDATMLDALRQRLTAPPDCVPHCAELARLRVEGEGSRLQLRLELHALADTMVLLPGQGTRWRPTLIAVDGKPAAARRDADGALWLALRAGVSQVVLAADVGDAGSVEIVLPMPPREVSMQGAGWALAGLDPRGVATGALSLTRSATARRAPDGGMTNDAFEPFVRVERVLHLGLRWTIETRISRLAPSRAPVRATVRLLAGEAVNSEVVRIEDGQAVVQLGAEESAEFTSTLKEATALELRSSEAPGQIELWRLEPSAQWHVGWSGIAPVRYVAAETGRLMPMWQPWPGERVGLTISKPVGAPGQTLTIDGLRLALTPGLRATDVSSTALLRSSQGGNHRVQLPDGAEFLGLTLDGQAQITQPQGRELSVPITPGAHLLKIDWREPRGIGTWFESSVHGLGAAGVDGRTDIAMPAERVVLAVGGPRVGPAVLFWGMAFTMGLVAFGLARTRMTPLGGVAWFLLALGLAQTSLAAAALVVGWFFALAARRRLMRAPLDAHTGYPRLARHLANAIQLLLLVWTLLAAASLLDAVRVGLLGYPDMMVQGNGSQSDALHWYQDRFTDRLAPVWVVSIPVLAYRLAMLAWALWLALAILRWVRWGWESFSVGGYWHKPIRVVAPVAAQVPPPPEPAPPAEPQSAG